MNCEEARIKINGLIDNELAESEIDALLDHLSACQSCKSYYKELLRMNREMSKAAPPDPADSWYVDFRKRFFRKTGGFLGRLFFIGSYLALLVYSLLQLFRAPAEDMALKLIVGGIFLGFLLLLGVSIADRIKESKNDRYRGVIR